MAREGVKTSLKGFSRDRCEKRSTGVWDPAYLA
jgi:hypothetical protein